MRIEIMKSAFMDLKKFGYGIMFQLLKYDDDDAKQKSLVLLSC